MIRRASISDVPDIMVLEKECLPHPWDKTAIDDLMTLDRHMALIAVDDGKAVGYIGFSWVLDECEIGNICVSRSFRRRGIASSLLARTESELAALGVRKIFLEVESDNAPAIALYERSGYVRYSGRKDYYGQGRDAELYCKKLPDSNCEI